jgi:hypothetical protein
MGEIIMARIRIDDLPLGEKLTPEQEELILGAGRQTFRPRLESLESRDLPDANINGAVIQQMLPQLSQGAQVRLWTQEASALQNQLNEVSQLQALQTQAIQGQAMHFVQSAESLAGLYLFGLQRLTGGLGEVEIKY